MRPIATISHVLIAIAALLILIGNSSALAASSCKGLSKSKCASSTSCTWVSGYTTEKGKKASAYCRAKSGKSSKSSEKTSKKADKSKKSEKKASKSTKESKQSGNTDKDKKSKGSTTK